MKKLFDWMMHRRAEALIARLKSSIGSSRQVADVGSGTGHNAACWRAALGVEVDEFDVADLHWVGAGPILWDGVRFPSAAAEYDAATLLFVLHYVPEPEALLQEVRRICCGRVVIVQSTYRGHWGFVCLAFRELVWGRLAFHAARLARLVRPQVCPLVPFRFFTREELRSIFDRAGFRVVSWESDECPGMSVSRDLYVLEPAGSPLPYPSSSRHATKSTVSVGH